jgi:transposase
MGNDLLHATPRSDCWTAQGATRGNWQVKQGRIWAYVRDQRPWAVRFASAVYQFAP